MNRILVLVALLLASPAMAVDTPLGCVGANCKVVIKTRNGSNAQQTAIQFSTALSTGLVKSDSSGNASASTLVNADVASNAAISFSKLASMSTGQILLGNAGTPTATTLSGDLSVDATGVAAIGSGVIVNADINASAAIQLSKLQSVSSGNIVMGIGGVASSVTLTGDVTVNGAGVTAIGSGVIVDADVNASAGISYSKLATMTTGQVLLGNAGTPTATTLSGDVTVGATGVTAIGSGVIVDADVNASAAIAGSKLQAAGSGNAGAVTTGTQTLAGAKTFSSVITSSAGINFGIDTLSDYDEQTVAQSGGGFSVTNVSNPNYTNLYWTQVGNAVIGSIDMTVDTGAAGAIVVDFPLPTGAALGGIAIGGNCYRTANPADLGIVYIGSTTSRGRISCANSVAAGSRTFRAFFWYIKA